MLSKLNADGFYLKSLVICMMRGNPRLHSARFCGAHALLHLFGPFGRKETKNVLKELFPLMKISLLGQDFSVAS